MLSDQELSDRLHSAAIHLLRKLRQADEASGLSASRLSALSVIVFGGKVTVGDLAIAEQVSVPTISRLLKDLEALELVGRTRDRKDGRVTWIHATPRGQTLLQEGRARRIALLAAELGQLSETQREALIQTLPIIETLAAPRKE